MVVKAIYPGANPQVIADTVATPIEEEVNGVEDMLYMAAQCASDGTMPLTVTFKIGTDLDKAQVLVQNRVSVAESATAGGSAPAGRHDLQKFAGYYAGGEFVFA